MGKFLAKILVLSAVFLSLTVPAPAFAYDPPAPTASIQTYAERPGDALRMGDVVTIWPDSGSTADFQSGGKFAGFIFKGEMIFNGKNCGYVSGFNQSTIPWTLQLPKENDCTLRDPYNKGGTISVLIYKTEMIDGQPKTQKRTSFSIGTALPSLLQTNTTGGVGLVSPGASVNVCGSDETNPSAGFAFYRDGSLIQAGQCKYTVREQDAGSNIRGVRANPQAGTMFSTGWRVDFLKEFTTRPTLNLDGVSLPGSQLTCSLVGDWAPKPTSVYFDFFLSGTKISSATGSTSAKLIITNDMIGKSITCSSRASMQGYRTLASTESESKIVSGFGISFPTIQGEVRVGQTLLASVAGWGSSASLSFQWLRDAVAIPGATSSSYIVSSGDVNRLISVRVTGTSPGFQTAVRVSQPVNIPKLASPSSSASPSSGALAPSPSPSPSSGAVLPGPSASPNKPTDTPRTIASQISSNPKEATPEMVVKLAPKELKLLSAEAFSQIPRATLSSMNAAQAKEVSVAQIVALGSKNITALTSGFVAALPPTVLKRLPVSSLKSLTTTQKKQITKSQLKALTPAQRKAIGR
jgi:hypothetical protein